MLLTDHVLEDRGGAIAVAIEAAVAPITAVTVAIANDLGGAVLAATSATIPGLNTTLDVAAAYGDVEIGVASLASGNIVVGDTFKIRSTDGNEQILIVDAVDPTGDRLYFGTPLLFPFDAATPVFGLVCRYTVSSSVISSTWWRGTATWSPTWSATVQDSVVVPLHATKYRIPVNVASASDLFQRFGRVDRLIDGASLAVVLADARVRILDELIEGGVKPHVAIPSERLKPLHCMAVMLDLRYRMKQDAFDWAGLERAFEEERLRVIKGLQWDADDDGVFGASEQPSPRIVRFDRA